MQSAVALHENSKGETYALRAKCSTNFSQCCVSSWDSCLLDMRCFPLRHGSHPFCCHIGMGSVPTTRDSPPYGQRGRCPSPYSIDSAFYNTWELNMKRGDWLDSGKWEFTSEQFSRFWWDSGSMRIWFGLILKITARTKSYVSLKNAIS